MLFKLLVCLFFFSSLCAQEKENSSALLSPEAREAILLNAATEDKHISSKTASKVLSLAEATQMATTLSSPDKNKHLEDNHRKATQDKMTKFYPFAEWHGPLLGWVTADNITFIILAFFRIIVILVIFTLLWKALNRFVNYYFKRLPMLKDGAANSDAASLIKTIAPIVRSTAHWVLIILSALLILSELNINIMPIIYSFSVLGLAISIGSQTLVKDLINGVMTLFEGNMAVGDVVTISNYTGIVESISLRCVHLRHNTGELQTIPFSEVNNVINRSRDYSVASIQFVVAYQANLEAVEEALKKVFAALKQSPKFKPYIQGDFQINGISSLTEWGFTVNASVKIIPDPGKSFINEFYRLLLKELQERHIPMPATALLSSGTTIPKPDEA